ncbi:response regulator [Salinisphaera sp. Q1T1-3]|uniref:response regulator n=1 Tax=Salinisphaera sp. Q1T1-3 TaxID=2321229 RepID=UPI0013148E20|nr:response regulator [Salinisphaera sp. Q1T1-3]
MRKTTRIAVIEDDDGFAASVLSLLASDGFGAERFASAEDFLRASAAGAAFDCLIIDWVLPGMSGESLCRQQAAETPLVNLVLMSGQHGPEALASPGPRAMSFLRKPFDPEHLLDLVTATPAATNHAGRLDSPVAASGD